MAIACQKKIAHAMSLEFIDDVFVKEEYTIEEYDADSSNPLFPEELTTKCGEVFLGHRGGNFTFVCTLCLQRFLDLASFGEHIHNVHPLPEDESSMRNSPEKGLAPPIAEHDEITAESEADNIEEMGDDSLDIKDSMDAPNHQSSEEDDQSEDEFLGATEPEADKMKHKKPAPYCCLSCGKLFFGFKWYRNHYRTEHDDMIEKDEPYGVGASRKTEFVPIAPKEMVCKFCHHTFDVAIVFEAHMKTGHAGRKRYSCRHCPSKFEVPSVRDLHMDAHEGIKRFQCPHCPRAFAHPTNLREHVNIHLDNKQYSCRFCGKKYVQNSALKVHERIHTKEKPFQCEECGKAFIAQIRLTEHMRRHNNVRNYKCTYCDKAFYNAETRNNHIRSHTKENPFNCDICDQKFRSTSSLRSHKLLHSGSKKFVCKVCGKAFAQYPGLYWHMKSHAEVPTKVK